MTRETEKVLTNKGSSGRVSGDYVNKRERGRYNLKPSEMRGKFIRSSGHSNTNSERTNR